jgi:hypothetical protein
MMPPAGRGGRGPYPFADLELALARRPFPNPAVALWRWRYEVLLLGAVASAVAAALSSEVARAALVVAGLGAVAALVLPRGRRWVRARFWCVVTPHRVRTACAETWLHNRSGRLPMVLWTSAEPYGERVLLWCRAGLTADDLADRRDALATACWAGDVRVSRGARRPYLVALAVVRRPVERAVAGRSAAPGDADDADVLLLPPAS